MLPTLSFDERRVLGVLIEKGFTTPDQYPLTLNGLVTGCSQKSCRNPVVQLGEEAVLDALDTLRQHGLVSIVQTAGGRTDRWRHRARDAFELDGPQAAVLAELLLRGPQTDGELRQNAKRMAPIESLEALGETLRELSAREPPIIERLGPEARRRGVRYAHRLYPEAELESLRQRENEAAASSEPTCAPVGSGGAVEHDGGRDELRREVDALRAEVDTLRSRLERLEAELGGA